MATMSMSKPKDDPQQQHQHQSAVRPYDQLGPPSSPIPFPRPQLVRGRRGDVVCYNPATGDHEVLKNVLFRDFGRSHHHHRNGANNTDTNKNGKKTSSMVKHAYWKIPYKEPIQTIMGHVEMCRVLDRCTRQHDDDSSRDDDDDDDSYDEDEDEEIVFEWTDRCVAVKVNYTDRMDRLRDRHAENPLQEIAAMQLLGEDPIHVLGAMEVLFDGQNLNLVMRFCDSGDLFQLLQDSQANNKGMVEDGMSEEASSTTPGLTEGQCRFWFRQIIEGVEFLHARGGICHRDLSPENIMIDGNEGVIIDMGMCLRVPYLHPTDPNTRVDINTAAAAALSLSNGLTTTTTTTTKRCLFLPQGACGKLPYMDPVIYANRQPFDGAAADVWTCGTILFCMITGNRSYQRPHMSDPQFYWMTQGLRQLLSDWNVTMSEEGIALLQGMIQIDPRLRLTIDEVKNHEWFNYPDEPPSTRSATTTAMDI